MLISESDMLFGDYDEANCFWIEKTDLYGSIAGKGYKSVEFVLHRPDRYELQFVEGRSTLPAQGNVERYNEDIAEISQKFMDSLQLACGIWFGEHNSKVAVPQNGRSFFEYGTQVTFVLVIKNRRGKMTAIAEKIKREILREYRLWGFKIVVMSEEIAIRDNLVVGEVVS